MDKLEVITSEGQGVWGGTNYEVRLLTSFRTYSDSSHQGMKKVIRFIVEFGPKSGSDRRTFSSEHARREFMEASFSDLHIADVPESRRESRRVDSPLRCIVGEYLSAVTFVMDYLQMDFSGNRFNMYCWPVVTISQKSLTHTERGYKNAICSLIGETLTEVEEYFDTGLMLQFANGASVCLSLRVDKDFPGPEVAEFSGASNKSSIIWHTGEEPFD
jgi:hypothetical protein